MTKKKRITDSNRIKLSTIVERLPMYRFLDDAHSSLLKLQPVWQEWCNSHLPAITVSSAHLSSFEGDTIVISADNSSTAALIKHQKSSLLLALQKFSLNNTSKNVKNIKVRIDLISTSAADDILQRATSSSDDNRHFERPNSSAIESVERLKSDIKNPELAESLGNLAETLKNLKND